MMRTLPRTDGLTPCYLFRCLGHEWDVGLDGAAVVRPASHPSQQLAAGPRPHRLGWRRRRIVAGRTPAAVGTQLAPLIGHTPFSRHQTLVCHTRNTGVLLPFGAVEYEAPMGTAEASVSKGRDGRAPLERGYVFAVG